jgi:hypothetical protein
MGHPPLLIKLEELRFMRVLGIYSNDGMKAVGKTL